MCAAASLQIDYVGPRVADLFDATRAQLSRNGWAGGEIFMKDQDFAVFEKNADGLRLDAIINKELFGLEMRLTAPGGAHMGELGFQHT